MGPLQYLIDLEKGTILAVLDGRYRPFSSLDKHAIPKLKDILNRHEKGALNEEVWSEVERLDLDEGRE